MKKRGYIILGMSEEMLNDEREYLMEEIELYLNKNNEAIPIIRLNRVEAIRMKIRMIFWYLTNHYRLKLRRI